MPSFGGHAPDTVPKAAATLRARNSKSAVAGAPRLGSGTPVVPRRSPGNARHGGRAGGLDPAATLQNGQSRVRIPPLSRRGALANRRAYAGGLAPRHVDCQAGHVSNPSRIRPLNRLRRARRQQISGHPRPSGRRRWWCTPRLTATSTRAKTPLPPHGPVRNAPVAVHSGAIAVGSRELDPQGAGPAVVAPCVTAPHRAEHPDRGESDGGPRRRALPDPPGRQGAAFHCPTMRMLLPGSRTRAEVVEAGRSRRMTGPGRRPRRPGGRAARAGRDYSRHAQPVATLGRLTRMAHGCAGVPLAQLAEPRRPCRSGPRRREDVQSHGQPKGRVSGVRLPGGVQVHRAPAKRREDPREAATSRVSRVTTPAP